MNSFIFCVLLGLNLIVLSGLDVCVVCSFKLMILIYRRWFVGVGYCALFTLICLVLMSCCSILWIVYFCLIVSLEFVFDFVWLGTCILLMAIYVGLKFMVRFLDWYGYFSLFCIDGYLLFLFNWFVWICGYLWV